VYSQSEVVNLILGLAMIPILASNRAGAPSRYTAYFVVGYCFMLVSYVSTVAEGYLAPEFFNVLEHGALAAAGCIFAIVMYLRRAEIVEILKEA